MKVLDKTISQITLPTPFAVGDTHVYILKGDTLSLVDAGVKTKESWNAFTDQIKKLGYSPNDIEQIILTHHHPDHIGLIEEFPRASRIVAHKNVNLWLTRNEAFFQEYERFFRALFQTSDVPEKYKLFLDKLRSPLRFAGEGEVTHFIDDGDVLPGHMDWKVVETKGHAQSHLSFIRERDGSFIGGDHILSHISSNPLLEPPIEKGEDRPRPMLDYRRNLEKCLDLGIKHVYPGHGDIISNIEELVPIRLSKQEHRANKVLTLLKEYAQTPFQLCQQIFPRQYEKQLDLTMSETIGQLDYLEDQNLVNTTIEGEITYYHAI